MNSKLLIICGPTATGKTSLGLELAKKFNGEIISADSRQVYRDMDIGTGKDLPVNSKLEFRNSKLGFHLIQGIKLYGYDLVGPTEDFSVSEYLKFAKSIITKIINNGKLPILVGGTGLYIKGVVDGIPTIDIPRNIELRDMLSQKTADELYESLSQIDSVRAASLNSSDKKNPRRLIRAIEIAQYCLDRPSLVTHPVVNVPMDTLFVGLTADQSVLDSRINTRVDDRIKMGFDREVKNLIESGVDWTNQSMMSLGYRQWRDYLEGAVDIETVTEEWKKEERKYSKRQLVWWKPDVRLNWFNIKDSEYRKKMENMIEKWYNWPNSDATKS